MWISNQKLPSEGIKMETIDSFIMVKKIILFYTVSMWVWMLGKHTLKTRQTR